VVRSEAVALRGRLFLNSDHSRSRSADNYNDPSLHGLARGTGLSPIAAAVAIRAIFACLAKLSGNPTRPSPSWAGFRKDRRSSLVVEGAATYAVRDLPAVSGMVRQHIKRGFTMKTIREAKEAEKVVRSALKSTTPSWKPCSPSEMTATPLPNYIKRSI